MPPPALEVPLDPRQPSSDLGTRVFGRGLNFNGQRSTFNRPLLDMIASSTKALALLDAV
jgi:hypothetical protein